MNPSCPYCGKEAILVTGQVIYPHRTDLYEKKFWQCLPCGAYVGCHSGGTTALGRLANAELRKAKMAAHAAFDPIWQSEEMTRSEAYAWLAKTLGIGIDDCHVGMFDVALCNRIIAICEERGKPPTPLPKEDINWDPVIRACQERLTEYKKGTDTDSDIPHYIYEAAMSAVFGSNVWDWTQATTKARQSS